MPFVGDWNGDGIDTIGLYNPTTATVYLRNENTTGYADITFHYGPAGGDWVPFVGDWNGDGVSTMGFTIRLPARSICGTKNTSGLCRHNIPIWPGRKHWDAIAGDWNATALPRSGFTIRLPGRSICGTRTHGFCRYNVPIWPGWEQLEANCRHWSDSSNTLTTTSNVTGSGETTALTQTELDTITNEAIRRWQASGVDADATAKLEAATGVTANLTGPKSAVIENGVIYLDRTAADYGWSVDPTPSSDEDYTQLRQARPCRADSLRPLTRLTC